MQLANFFFQIGSMAATAFITPETMLKNTAKTPEPDEIGDDQSSKTGSFINLPQEVIDEERKLAAETEQRIYDLTRNAAPVDEEERQKRYKTLMTLLGKSNQYAAYMSKKLLKSQEEQTIQNSSPKVLSNATNKRKNAASLRGKGSKKRRTESNELKYNPETEYINDAGLVVSVRQPKLLVGAVMRNYQLDGLDWLVTLYKNAVNGILADEMGLGKTIQVISLICHLREKNIYGPHLIIGPLSTLPNWMLEFANFAPNVPVVLFHGNLEKRLAIREQYVKILTSKDRSQLPVLLTSYEMPLLDTSFLSAVRWCYTIVDEGHRLKNYNSLLSIQLRKYKTESRLLLTGTPLQNNLTELWSLLNYLIPEIFDNLPMFESLFDFGDLADSESHNELIEKERTEQILSKMHQILEPFLLRRLKSDVNIFLPHKKEVLVYAPMTQLQETLYRSVLDRSVVTMANPEAEEVIDSKTKRRCTQNVSYDEAWDIDEDADYVPFERQLQQGKTKKRVKKNGVEYVYTIKLTNPPMMLRKIANHPYLVETPVYPGTREIIIDERMISSSGKLLVLDALLPRLKAENHKVLLFSTFTILLDLIEDYVMMRGHKSVRLDGNNKIDDRLEAIKRFNSDPETFIFLISTKAGGLGINLMAADTVIIFDSAWNPQVDLQAQDRCHRIGQTRPVIVYRLVTAGTVDERVVEAATTKRRLEKLVVRRGKFKQEVQSRTEEELLSIDELQELLNSTDYRRVIHPNGLVLSDQQIEELLDRSDLLKEAEEERAAYEKGKTCEIKENVS